MGLDQKEWRVLAASLVILVYVGYKQENGADIREQILQKPFFLRCVLYLTVILCIMLFGTYGFGFDAQEFIYQRF